MPQSSSTPCSAINCQICQCKLDMAANITTSNIDDNFSKHYLDFPDLDVRLRDGLGLAQSGNLLEIICNSSNPLQFPLCKKCVLAISTALNKQLSDLELECVNYKKTLDQLVAKRSDIALDQEMTKKKLDDFKKEESDLIDELKRLEDEERSLSQELESKQRIRKMTKDKDSELYRKLRNNHRILIERSEKNRSLRTQIKYVNEQLQKLVRVNVLDMTFFIWKDGDYGTINGLRLGRLRHELVEWNEINAAFGQIAFLLQVLAERIDIKFDGYEICPCGSHSFIRENRANGTKHDLALYGNGGWRPFGQSNLDQAIVAYMECFCQLENKLKSYFPPGTQILPYRMAKDMLIDNDSPYLVKMQLNSEERWTKAMKCLLLNLKRAIGIVVNIRSIMSASAVAPSIPCGAFSQPTNEEMNTVKTNSDSGIGSDRTLDTSDDDEFKNWKIPVIASFSADGEKRKKRKKKCKVFLPQHLIKSTISTTLAHKFNCTLRRALAKVQRLNDLFSDFRLCIKSDESPPPLIDLLFHAIKTLSTKTVYSISTSNNNIAVQLPADNNKVNGDFCDKKKCIGKSSERNLRLRETIKRNKQRYYQTNKDSIQRHEHWFHFFFNPQVAITPKNYPQRSLKQLFISLVSCVSLIFFVLLTAGKLFTAPPTKYSLWSWSSSLQTSCFTPHFFQLLTHRRFDFLKIIQQEKSESKYFALKPKVLSGKITLKVQKHDGVRKFFESMVGRFCANSKKPAQSFFSTKPRWRANLGLTAFALTGNKLVVDKNDEHRHVSMLLTEQPRAVNASDRSVSAQRQQQSFNRASSPLPSGSGSVAQQRRDADPSLMDYEAIDVYWRRDIEQEKGGVFSTIHSLQSSHTSNFQQPIDTVAEQFERDLQLLTEKTLYVALNNGEQFRYENFSKAYYSDFYRTVDGVVLVNKKNSGCASNIDSDLLQRSYYVPSSCSDGNVPSSSFPLSASTILKNDCSTSSSTFSTFPNVLSGCSGGSDDGLKKNKIIIMEKTSDNDQSKEFFQSLAKDDYSEDFESLSLFPLKATSQQRILLLTNGCSTGYESHSALFNNVSLADATCENMTNANTTEFVNFNLTDVLADNEADLENAEVDYLFGLHSGEFVNSNATRYGNLMDDEGFTDNDNNIFLNREPSCLLTATQVPISDPEVSQTYSHISWETNEANNEDESSSTSSFVSSLGISSSNANYFGKTVYQQNSQVRYGSTEERTTPSSGIDSEFCESPESSLHAHFDQNKCTALLQQNFTSSRFYNKLVPNVHKDESSTADKSQKKNCLNLCSSDTPVIKSDEPRRRGRRSKDEQLVSENELPASAEAITRMTHAEIQLLMRDSGLSSTQKQLIKKIRRRGRNKVAARKCRERRVHPSNLSSVSSSFFSDDFQHNVTSSFSSSMVLRTMHYSIEGEAQYVNDSYDENYYNANISEESIYVDDYDRRNVFVGQPSPSSAGRERRSGPLSFQSSSSALVTSRQGVMAEKQRVKKVNAIHYRMRK